MITKQITIEGNLLTYEYCSRKFMEEHEDSDEGFGENYYTLNGWTKVDALYVDGDSENNLIRKKGKMFKTTDYLHHLFSEEGHHPLPVELHKGTEERYASLEYVIELEDDEEFDIKKLQLVYTMELSKVNYKDIENCPPVYPIFFSSFILAEKIMYDGKDVQLAEDNVDRYYDFCIIGDECDKVVIEGWRELE